MKPHIALIRNVLESFDCGCLRWHERPFCWLIAAVTVLRCLCGCHCPTGLKFKGDDFCVFCSAPIKRPETRPR